MKRDDMGMRISEIRTLATKYSKPELAKMVQMGLVPPQQAVMAGMMIDRITKSAMQPPQTTVADDVLATQQPQMPGQPPQGAPQSMPPQGMPQQPPPVMAADGGMMGLPVGNVGNYAGGGIVAFADGGTPQDYVAASRSMDALLAPQPQQPLTMPGGYSLREYTQPSPTNIKSEIAGIREAEREAGVDTGIYERMRQEEAGRRDELKGRREEAKNEALLMAGLGLMGARRGQEFETLANVGRQAVQQYGGALKEIRDNEKDIKKTERELMMAEDRAKRDMSGKALGAVQSKQVKLDELQNRSVDQYNDAVKTLSKIFADEKRVDKETATRMAIAELERKTRIDVETIQQRGAYGRAGMGETSMLADRVLADLRKTNPQATLSDALAVVRGSGKTTQPQLIESYADDYNKLDIMQRKDFEKRGITNEEDYIKYRIGLANKYSGGTQSSLPSPPSAAVSYLKSNPNLAADFDSKYGAGAAARILGAR